MNPKIKSQWIEALISGNYLQGHCYLRSSNDLFSVLGVLADLAVQKNVGSWYRNQRLIDICTGTKKHPYQFVLPENQMTERDYGHAIFFLPNQVLNSCGLDFGTALYIMQRNDEGWTFEQLAKEIDDGFPGQRVVHLTTPAAAALV